MRKLKQIIVHCSDSNFGNAALIDEWHKARNWRKIGYHFVILNGLLVANDDYSEFVDGLIETGRPVQEEGAHTLGSNADSIGICLIGTDNFTEKQFTSLIALIKQIKKDYGVKEIKGHYHFASNKTCPNFRIEAITDFLDKGIENREKKGKFLKQTWKIHS